MVDLVQEKVFVPLFLGATVVGLVVGIGLTTVLDLSSMQTKAAVLLPAVLGAPILAIYAAHNASWRSTSRTLTFRSTLTGASVEL
jgi:uncharacterized membrane protein YeaQ/YmgE (transglycosylase-associated protein family)